MKNARQAKILELIEASDIQTQGELVEKLHQAGIRATQTTVSRDIVELKLIKEVTHEGTYRYSVPGHHAHIAISSQALTSTVISAEIGENILVIRTHAGLAGAVAVAVDAMKLTGALGSVAGDDTLIIVFRSKEIAEVAIKQVKQSFSI